MKKMTLKVALLAALVATAGMSVAADMASVEAEIKAANAALDKAKKVDGEWRDARWKKSKAVKCGGKKMSMLAAAKCEADAGNFDKAMKLAKKAKKQGELGYQQSMDYKDAGQRF